MPAINLVPELFEVEAVSRDIDDLQNVTFVIRTRLQGTSRLQGTYEVREYLSDNGVDEKRIAFAIEELSRTGQVKVWNQPQKKIAA